MHFSVGKEEALRKTASVNSHRSFLQQLEQLDRYEHTTVTLISSASYPCVLFPS